MKNLFYTVIVVMVVCAAVILIVWFSFFIKRNVTEKFNYRHFTEKYVEETVNRILSEKGLITREEIHEN